MADIPLTGIGSALIGSATADLSPDPAPVAATPGASVAPQAPPSAGQVRAAVADANHSLAEIGTQLTFVFDDQLHQTLVKIVDTQTHQVVQQIPSEAMLAAARALSGTPSSGALVNTKA
jgi:uncharacterized FlaG/YvyC family protein